MTTDPTCQFHRAICGHDVANIDTWNWAFGVNHTATGINVCLFLRELREIDVNYWNSEWQVAQ